MKWYEIENVDQILTPAIAVFPDRIQQNIDAMIQIAGSADRLRPHVKTYKTPQIVKLQMDAGITKFKCATVSEAEMVIKAGCKDLLLAMPIVGPAQQMILNLKRKYPDVRLSVLIDHKSQIQSWLEKLKSEEIIDLYLDINVGMSRTGIVPPKAKILYDELAIYPKFKIRGLHVYDGHNRIKDFNERNALVQKEYEEVDVLINDIEGDNLEIICGGSVTFPCHAQDERKTLSPGTTLLWDAGYGSQFTDIPMLHAAVLITRVISKPGTDRICLDLGHKSVGSEMQDRRVVFPQLEKYERVGHSEEHLVLKVPDRSSINIGDVFYGIPWHICPTVALHAELAVVKSNEIRNFWPVTARHRVYNIG